MEKNCCKCGIKLKFDCKIIDGDEIWSCLACGIEYLYNAEKDLLYSRDKYGRC